VILRAGRVAYLPPERAIQFEMCSHSIQWKLVYNRPTVSDADFAMFLTYEDEEPLNYIFYQACIFMLSYFTLVAKINCH